MPSFRLQTSLLGCYYVSDRGAMSRGRALGFYEGNVQVRTLLAFLFMILALHYATGKGYAQGNCPLQDDQIQRIRTSYKSPDQSTKNNARSILRQLAITDPDCLIPFVGDIYSRANINDLQIYETLGKLMFITTLLSMRQILTHGSR